MVYQDTQNCPECDALCPLCDGQYCRKCGMSFVGTLENQLQQSKEENQRLQAKLDTKKRILSMVQDENEAAAEQLLVYDDKVQALQAVVDKLLADMFEAVENCEVCSFKCGIFNTERIIDMSEKVIGTCNCCGFEKVYVKSYPRHEKEPLNLCDLCAGTFTSRVVMYPGQDLTINEIGLDIAYIGNAIIDAIYDAKEIE